MNDVRMRAGELAAGLEAELRRLSCWSATPPTPDPARDGPFGMRTMAFEQWIQVVLVPALREIAVGARPVPPCSFLAAHAVREFDGSDDRDELCNLLGRVDDLSPPAPGPGMQPRLASPIAWIALLALLVWAWPSAVLAGDTASLLFGRPADKSMLIAFLERGEGFWRDVHVSGWAEVRGDRLRFLEATLSVGMRPGQAARPRALELHLTETAPLAGAEFSAAGLLRAAGSDAAPGPDTEALLEWLAALRQPIAGDDVEAKFAAFARAAGPATVPHFDLQHFEGRLGDGGWFAGFCVLYVPLALAVLVWVARAQRRRRSFAG